MGSTVPMGEKDTWAPGLYQISDHHWLSALTNQLKAHHEVVENQDPVILDASYATLDGRQDSVGIEAVEFGGLGDPCDSAFLNHQGIPVLSAEQLSGHCPECLGA